MYLDGPGIYLTLFDDKGEINGAHWLSKDKSFLEIPPYTFHTGFSLDDVSTMFEISQGPYIPKIYKTFAEWAPSESDVQLGKQYLIRLTGLVKDILGK